jgi:DNA helicase-2/ATP-dependent DNA helicase PcrA
MPVNTIVSDAIIDTEQHFRVAAGPGAGKTHWLVLHIKNVLQHSKRLGRTKKIACITYTNVAVDTILRRLDFVAERVSVSTIHGFIYANIIKPYISFIAQEYELDVTKMDGHEDMIVSRKKIMEWLNHHRSAGSLAHPYTVNQLTQRPENIEALSNWLSSITFEFNNDQLEIRVKNGEAFYMTGQGRRMLNKSSCLDILSPCLLDFKKIYWRNGILHHDDVLFFGYLLLKKYPFIVSVIQSKFPYFFIDEFQDTSPVQNAILNLVGQRQITVGVIGDKAQSIYSFQGASLAFFDAFAFPGFADYVIADNRRSTSAIIDLLNHVRKDIRQNPVRQVTGVKPILFVGNRTLAVAEATKRLGHSNFNILARDNITSNAMKRQFDSSIPLVNLISEFTTADQDSTRRGVGVSCIKATELARQKKFKEAIKEIEKNFYHIRDRALRKKTAFRHLAFLLAQYEDYKYEKFIVFCNLLKTVVRPDIAKLSRGAAFNFCSNKTYEQLAVCINIPDDNSKSRTIHKSKGDEFDDVLVLMKDKTDLAMVLNPNLASEEQRIWYVAASRARNNLMLNIPELDQTQEAKLPTVIEVVKL